MIKWYNTLISVVLALAIGFVACLVLVPREIVVQPIMHFSPTMQIGPESIFSTPEQTSGLPSAEKQGKEQAEEIAGVEAWFRTLLEGWLAR